MTREAAEEAGEPITTEPDGAPRLLTGAMLERSFDEGLKLYDFLGGGESHKLDWMADTRPLVRLHAFERHRVVDRRAHAADRAMALEPVEPGRGRRVARDDDHLHIA